MSSVEENSPLLAQGMQLKSRESYQTNSDNPNFLLGSNDRPQAGSVYYVDVPTNLKEISCEVCNARVDISTKRDQHVVKCESCSEATVSFPFDIKLTLTVC